MGRIKQTLVEHYPHITNLADPQGLYQLMQAHLLHLRVKQYSAVTVTVREHHLCRFLEWCGQRDLLRPTEITQPILERYQRYLFHYRKQNGNPMSSRYQFCNLSAIRVWFRWLMRQKHLLYNPASELELPRVGRYLPKQVLTEAEAERVISQPDIGQAFGLRDRAILETLYSTGLRRKEVCNVLVHDVDYERGTVFVREGKGRRDRMVPIGERALRWIDKYLTEVRPELSCGRDAGALFLGRYGEAMSPTTLANRVLRYTKQAKLGRSGSCHQFRHAMATLMLENGADIRFIQAILGHVSLSTTEIYTGVSIKKLKEIHTLTHPARMIRPQRVDAAADAEEPEATEEALFSELAREAEEDDGD